MSPRIPDQPGATYYIDYRPAKCRCGTLLQPHQLICPHCGRRQTLLFQGLDRLYEDDIEGLINTFKRMAENNPNDAMLLNQLAGAYLLNGCYEKAKEIYRKAISLNPTLAEARLNLGGVLAYLGENDAAIRELREFVKLDLHSPRVERALRAISTLEGREYEDVVAETGAKKKGFRTDRKQRKSKGAQKEAPKALERKPVRGTMYSPQASSRKKAFGPIDVILWIFVLAIIGMWYFIPARLNGLINSAFAEMEKQYEFHAESGDLAGAPASEDEGIGNEGGETEEEEEAGAIVNADPESESYFPLATGNEWVYSSWDSYNIRGEGERMNESTVVVRVMSLANNYHGIWRVRNGQETVYYVERDNGLYSVVGANGPMSTMISQVPYPPEIGTTREEGGQRLVVESEELVETSMGLFRCIKIHYTLEPLGMEWYGWYAQGVGLVKYVGGGRGGVYHVRELRSYELN